MKILDFKKMRNQCIKNPKKEIVESIDNASVLTEALGRDTISNLAQDFETYATENGGEAFIQKGRQILQEIDIDLDDSDKEDDDLMRVLDQALRYNLRVMGGGDEKSAVKAHYAKLMSMYAEDPESVSSEELAEAKQQVGGIYAAEYVSVMLQGIPGVAKTASVKAWCEKHGFTLFEKSLYGLDETAIAGMPIGDAESGEIKMFTSEFIQDLYKCEKPCVIFFDEYNRGNMDVRNAALGLILNHTALVRGVDEISESSFVNRLLKRTKGDIEQVEEKLVNKKFKLGRDADSVTESTVVAIAEKDIDDNVETYVDTNGNVSRSSISASGIVIPNLLLVVAAMNPDESPEIKAEKQGLKGAENDRFKKYVVEADKKRARKYLYQLLLTMYAYDVSYSEARAKRYNLDVATYVPTQLQQQQTAIRELLLAYTIYTSPDFSFMKYADYVEKLDKITLSGKVPAIPSVRTIESMITYSEGYKDQFIQQVKEQGYEPEDVNMFLNVLEGYEDPVFKVEQGKPVIKNPKTGQTVDNLQQDLIKYLTDVGVDSAKEDVQAVSKEVDTSGVIATTDIDDYEIDDDLNSDFDIDILDK